jgi:NAD+ diphosphatase
VEAFWIVEGQFALAELRPLADHHCLPRADLAALSGAKSLLGWHQRHKFCAQCGQPTRPAEGGWRRNCVACAASHFPRTDPVVIMLATHGDQCLMGRQPRFPAGMYSALAGFVEPGENIEEAVRREIMEEAGIAIGRVDYIASQPWPFPSQLMIGCFAQALSTDVRIDHTELEDARWFCRADIGAILAGTHPELISPRPTAIARSLMHHWYERG